MGLVRTDDAARRLEFVLLGPPSFRLLVDTTPVVWGMWAGLSALGWAMAWSFLPGLGWFLLLGSWSSPTLAALSMRWVRPHVDRITPASYYLKTAIHEVQAPRPPSTETDVYETTFSPRSLTHPQKKDR